MTALTVLGLDAERACHAGELFVAHDEWTLRDLHAIREDQKPLVSLVAAARDDLERLMQAEAGASARAVVRDGAAS